MATLARSRAHIGCNGVSPSQSFTPASPCASGHGPFNGVVARPEDVLHIGARSYSINRSAGATALAAAAFAS
ncbi:hypothetical protein, partial [Cellulomonas fengjieae]|uniref:hypothetical protein n=1 Tax=Cellulomonas fengjieae TaxID=2819978 RepID=UPI001AAE7A3B